MYQPWIAHTFPGLKPGDMVDLRWSTYVAMWDSLNQKAPNGS